MFFKFIDGFINLLSVRGWPVFWRRVFVLTFFVSMPIWFLSFCALILMIFILTPLMWAEDLWEE